MVRHQGVTVRDISSFVLMVHGYKIGAIHTVHSLVLCLKDICCARLQFSGFFFVKISSQLSAFLHDQHHSDVI
jgi:hypothetical protein